MAAPERKQSTSSFTRDVEYSAPYEALYRTESNHQFDRGWSWVVDIGVFLVSFLIVGWFRCYGIVFLAIQDLHVESLFDISWVGTSNAICFHLFAPLGCLLAERFSSRTMVMTGGVVIATGLVAGYFCTSLVGYILTIGVINGIGAALAHVPAIIMLGVYFRKRMGIATGIAFSGSSCSQFVMPLLVSTMIDYYGLHGTFLVLGGLSLNICVSGAVLFPVSAGAIKAADDDILRQLAMDDLKKKREENPIVKKAGGKESTEKSPQPVIDEDEVFSDQPLISTDKKETTTEPSRTEPRFQKQRASTSSTGGGVARRASRFSIQLPTRMRRFSVRRMSMGLTTLRKNARLTSALSNLKSPILWMLMIGYSVGGLVFVSGMKYFPPHALEQGLRPSQLSQILALAGIPDILTRVAVGYILDTKFISTRFKRYRLFGTSLFILSVACFIIPFTRTFGSCLATFLLFGVGAGSFFTTSSVACFDLMGRERYKVSYGWMLFMASITITIDSLGVANLRDATGDYTASFLLIGATVLVASICVFMEQFLLKSRMKQHSDW